VVTVFDSGVGRATRPFRTWRKLPSPTKLRKHSPICSIFNLPQRWSIVHLYQAMLNHESHIKDIAMLTTLSGMFIVN